MWDASLAATPTTEVGDQEIGGKVDTDRSTTSEAFKDPVGRG